MKKKLIPMMITPILLATAAQPKPQPAPTIKACWKCHAMGVIEILGSGDTIDCPVCKGKKFL